MTNRAEALKALKDVNFLIYSVGAYTLALSLALLTAIIPWVSIVGIAAANVLLVIKITILTDLPRRFFILCRNSDIPISNAQVIIVITSSIILITAVILYGLAIDQNPIGLKPGENQQ